MYQAFLRPSRAAVRADAEPEVPVPDAAPSRGAEQLQYGLSSAQGRDGADRRSGHRQDDAAAGGARVRALPERAVRLPEQSGADARPSSSRCSPAVRAEPEAAQSKTVLLERARARASRAARRGEITALVVDEAQSLSTELLEEIRLLANIETHDREAAAARAGRPAGAGGPA